jgi:PhnB protein
MKTTLVHPFLSFGGRCEEAIAFYCTALDAKVEMLRHFKESPEPLPGMPLDWGDKVMHAILTIGASRVMATDGCWATRQSSECSLSLTLPDEAAAHHAFATLAKDGTVGMPLEKTFWSPCFGMVTDRFGISWMVTVET